MKKIFLLLGACIVLGSCSTEDAATAAQVTRSSSQALLYLNCRAVSDNEIEFDFSRSVTVKHIDLGPETSIDSVENGSTVRVRLERNLEPGILITADLLAEDERKNTINVLTSFRSRNNRMPALVINEICTENVSSSQKTEFIELRMMSDGNLGAMRVVILGNTNATKLTVYEFMPAEVRRNQYVTLHLRTLEENCINEYNGNIEESGSKNSSPLAWDFYMPGNTKWLQTDASVIYVLDQDDNVLDAVMFSKDAYSQWGKDYHGEAAGFLFSQGAWRSPEGEICIPADAVNSTGATNTRTICRDENAQDTNTAADWYIVYTSSATPGKPNITRRWN